jgi:hypothetical protein
MALGGTAVGAGAWVSVSGAAHVHIRDQGAGTWLCCRRNAAAETGHVAVLRWAREHGCPCPEHHMSL